MNELMKRENHTPLAADILQLLIDPAAKAAGAGVRDQYM